MWCLKTRQAKGLSSLWLSAESGELQCPSVLFPAALCFHFCYLEDDCTHKLLLKNKRNWTLMKAGESCFKGQICGLFFFQHRGVVVMERAGHGPSQREAKESERRLATHKGWLSTP